MPIENERKYVISEDSEKSIASQAEKFIKIEQKYLAIEKGFSVRVRSSNNDSYCLTVKKNCAGQCVEIETPISEDDFKRLWSTGSNKVSKIRYIYQGWEIDFFKTPIGKNYFAVAEIELFSWQKTPNFIPQLITDHLIFTVPIGDGRFSNKKLGNIKYASQLLESVKKVK